jgi:Zn-dependent M28 family amino/carboxypeptidase
VKGGGTLVTRPSVARFATLLLCLILPACDALRGQRARTTFDGERALAYAAQQVAFGPRVPGTEAHRRAGDWIVAEMRKRADTVIEQRWTHVTARGDTLALRNVLARIAPARAERVLYLVHWDTRPTADEDPVLGNRGQRIPGANDGASGVGLLVAIADALKRTPPTVGVDLLFVDGEDYGEFGDLETHRDVLIGSRWFADHLPSPDYRPLYGVLFDMIGDRELNIPQEANSVSAAPEVVSRVWDTAASLGYARWFVPRQGLAIDDDHIPLIRRGLRVIDVIDIDYGPPDAQGGATPNYHHTLADTMDKISARSLQIVGDVAVALVTGGP